MKKAIIIGASSGIGEALAKQLHHEGFTIGITGRRVSHLQKIQKRLGSNCFIAEMDITLKAKAISQFNSLVSEMGGVDMVIVSSGTGHINPELQVEKEFQTIDVNVTGFTAITVAAMKHFISQKSGHLIGISSIAAIRGEGDAPSYGASKAYVSNYLEGMAKKAHKLRIPIFVTDVQPGFVDTAMAQGDGLFWIAPVEKAAQQIVAAINKRKRKVYITRRWSLIAWLLKLLPFKLYKGL